MGKVVSTNKDINFDAKIKDALINLLIVTPFIRFINELPQWLFIILLCTALILALKYLIIPSWGGIEFLYGSIISNYSWWKAKNNSNLIRFHLKFISSLIYIAGFVISLVIINLLLCKSFTDRIIWSLYCFYLLCYGIFNMKKNRNQIILRSEIINTIIYFTCAVISCAIFNVIFPKIPTIVSRVFFIIVCLYFLYYWITNTIKSHNNSNFSLLLKNILWCIYFILLLLNYTYNMNIIFYPINSISKLFTGKPVFGECVEYERGFLKLYKSNGYRIYKSPNGYIAEGNYKNKMLNGESKIIYDNGLVIEGNFINNMLNGEGKITKANNCCVEIGYFIDNKLNGKGKITHKKNRIDEGYFIDSMLNGKGKIIYENGCCEEGFFINNKLNGRGKKTHIINNGYYIEDGYFKDNILNGEGKITYVVEDEHLDKEDYFINNIINGKGIINVSNSHIEKGNFVDGKLSKGIVIYSDGSSFEGTYIDGYANGEGKLTYASGRVKEGTFLNGDLINGRIHNTDGSIEEGSFIDGWLSEGKRTYKDGSVYEGNFIYGEIMEGKARIITQNEDVKIVLFVLGNMHEIPINIHHKYYDDEYLH